jgi:diguanylate cyclase (GGDEF)-like protein
MRHKAVLLGKERHRGLIAFINERVSLGDDAETLIFAEAIRYTSVAVTSFTMEGQALFENPMATALYGGTWSADASGLSQFEQRFADHAEGKQRLLMSQSHKDSRQEHMMRTREGMRRHAVDIRCSRHPLSGYYIFTVSEYDVSKLHEALREAEQAKEELNQLAYYDALTGLPSMRLFRDRLHCGLLQAKREKSCLALMFMDLDGFKAVNDRFGHAVGDQVLVAVARRLAALLREVDTVARWGGDEFTILLGSVQRREDAANVAKKIVQSMGREIELRDESGQAITCRVGASVGIALYPESAEDEEALLKAADRAMYASKRSGKNRYGIYND